MDVLIKNSSNRMYQGGQTTARELHGRVARLAFWTPNLANMAFFGGSWHTRVKLAVSSSSRHFCDFAKKLPTQKRADKIKKLKKHIMVKSYYKQLRRIISNNF